ncbi:MAG: hypothetical protein J0M24_10850 [Verrucomicrobia bacterium]|nr:hypothetical protein [Verrucomicrobiota bacterium]
MNAPDAPPPFLDAVLVEAELSARLNRPPPEWRSASPEYVRDRQGRPLHQLPAAVTQALALMQYLASGAGSEVTLDADRLESLVAALDRDTANGRLTEARQLQLQTLFLADVEQAIRQGRSGGACPVESLGDLWQPDGAEVSELPSGALDVRTPVGWVLMVGLGSETLPSELERAASAVGAVIAATGHGLIAGGWPGVDQYAAEGFLSRLALDRRSPSSWLRVYVEPKREPRVAQGAIEEFDTVEESIDRSVEEADVVILLSGAGGTAQIGRSALAAGLPVLALAGSGGDAERLYGEACQALERQSRVDLSDGLRRLGQPVEDALFALPGLLLELARDRQESQRAVRKRPLQKNRPSHRR